MEFMKFHQVRRDLRDLDKTLLPSFYSIAEFERNAPKENL